MFRKRWFFAHHRDHFFVLFITFQNRMTRFGNKVGQIWPKWDKSVTFPDHISVHSGSPSHTKTDLKKVRHLSHLGTIWPNLEPNMVPLGKTLYTGGNHNSWPACTDVRFSRHVVRLVLNILEMAITLVILKIKMQKITEFAYTCSYNKPKYIVMGSYI